MCFCSNTRGGQRAVPYRPRPIKGKPTRACARAVSCPLAFCAAPSHAHFVFRAVPTRVVPCLGKKSPLSFFFCLFYFFKRTCQIVVLFFSTLYTFLDPYAFIQI